MGNHFVMFQIILKKSLLWTAASQSRYEREPPIVTLRYWHDTSDHVFVTGDGAIPVLGAWSAQAGVWSLTTDSGNTAWTRDSDCLPCLYGHNHYMHCPGQKRDGENILDAPPKKTFKFQNFVGIDYLTCQRSIRNNKFMNDLCKSRESVRDIDERRE